MYDVACVFSIGKKQFPYLLQWILYKLAAWHETLLYL